MRDQTTFRCAIYTRKSSEEGLEQDFNSLEAQREACEAYIRSQAHEGWKLVPDRYDDGGFSGGNMERPALARLMEQLRENRIDIIVVYKIDRLTRSLTDFARLAETFDKHKVSFVSVTQQFNTTSSMGRLMLNVLLSFAQFEREITGERIRDKIAASKKKGMWMGGVIPMGYTARDRQLFVNEEEAATIRCIFALYLEEGTVPDLLDRLDAEQILTAPRLSEKARRSGSRRFTRGHLYKLLSNPIYIGRVPHKKASHPGRHEAIVDQKTWAEVQAQLSRNTRGPRDRRRRAEAQTHLLAELLTSADGNRFIATHANKGPRRYRYYVEQVEGEKSPRRLPATAIEAATVSAVGVFLRDQHEILSHLGDVSPARIPVALTTAIQHAELLSEGASPAQSSLLRALLKEVRYFDTHLELVFSQDGLRRSLEAGDTYDEPAEGSNHQEADDLIRYRVPTTLKKRGPQTKLILQGQDNNPPDDRLIAALAQSRLWAGQLADGTAKSLTHLAAQSGVSVATVSRILPLGYLAPRIIEDIVSGRTSPDFLLKPGARRHIDIDWDKQLALVER